MADDDNTRSYRSGAPFPRGGSSNHASGQGQGQGQGGDPLAELARLIGQHDPFADLGRGSAKRAEQRQIAPPQPRDPTPEPEPPPQPSQSDWRSTRASQDRYQEQPADDYSSRDYSDRNYANYSDQNYASQDYGTRQSYSDQDYRARDPRASSAEDAYRDGYSERDYGRASDPNYGEQDYRAAEDPQQVSGQNYSGQHYDERAPFDSHGGRGHSQTYGEQAYGDQVYGNFAPDPQGRYDQAYAQQGADQSYAQQGADDGSYQDPRYYGQGRPPMGDDETAYDDAPRSRGRGGIITIVAVLALAMVGTAAAFAYRSYFGGGTGAAPPVIRADVGPNKVVPPTPGDGGGNKLQQDRFAGQGERVVSREEQPIPFGDGAVRSVTPRVVPPGTGPSGLPSNATSLAPTNGTVGTDRPRPVRTVPIRQDQTSGPDPFAQQPNGAAPGTRGVAAPPSRGPAPPQNANGPVSLGPPQGDTAAPSIASRTPAPLPPSRSVTPPVRNATDNSGWFVQLSAQKSEDEAESSFRAMQGKFPNLLGNREAVIRRKDISGKGTFFGAQVGPFASREEAGQLCDSLKSQGGTCLVQKN
jgi:cell division septation protein DedD